MLELAKHIFPKKYFLLHTDFSTTNCLRAILRLVYFCCLLSLVIIVNKFVTVDVQVEIKNRDNPRSRSRSKSKPRFECFSKQGKEFSRKVLIECDRRADNGGFLSHSADLFLENCVFCWKNTYPGRPKTSRIDENIAAGETFCYKVFFK